MTQQDLVDLGFELISWSEEALAENGWDDDPYYYYFLESKVFTFTSNTSTEFDLPDPEGDGWYVEIEDYENIRFYKKEEFKTFVELLEKNTRKDA